MSKIGKVIIPANAKPWPHEKRVAEILSLAGYRIEFIPETNIKTADIYLEKTIYEIKSPISSKIDAVERNLVRASKQCPNIIFDSSRMKIRDTQILRELIKCFKRGKGIKSILFINKHREIIDIKTLV